MKKNVLALSIATAVVGFAGSAHAITAPDTTGTAATLAFSDTGIGHQLLVPYFTTQNNNATLLSLINTDTVNGKAVKVRFRGAKNSDDVFDFQVFLSPGDVWTANVSANAQGQSTLHTSDATCTKPDASVINTTPFQNMRSSGANDAEGREGYIEIFNMADIPGPTQDGYVAKALYEQIKHVKSVAPCGTTNQAVWTGLDTDTDAKTLRGYGLNNPTTGLMANWSIVNVPKSLSWSGSATAIQAATAVTDTAAAVPGTGNIVYFPQTDDTNGNAALFTADPLFLSGALTANMFDLPDMSTPYAGAGTPSDQAIALTEAIASKAVINEFWTVASIDADTDWVLSMPTRRYAVAVDYAKKAAVFNKDNAAYFTSSNTTLVGDQLCISGVSQASWDREENSISGGTVISPGRATPFCGEVSVLGFNTGNATAGEASAVLGAKITNKDVDTKGVENGWLQLNTPGLAGAGLPVLGLSFVSAYNSAVAAGTAGNYGVSWSHRYVRP